MSQHCHRLATLLMHHYLIQVVIIALLPDISYSLAIVSKHEGLFYSFTLLWFYNDTIANHKGMYPPTHTHYVQAINNPLYSFFSTLTITLNVQMKGGEGYVIIVAYSQYYSYAGNTDRKNTFTTPNAHTRIRVQTSYGD